MVRKIWMAVVGGFLLTIAFAALVPRYRLNREIEGARTEGLWLNREEMFRALHHGAGGVNADPLVRDLLGRIAVSPVAKPPDLPAWRKISNCSFLRSDRMPGFVPDPFLNSQNFVLTSGVDVLASAAEHGEQPKENLLAAARLVRLIGSEPSLGGLQWFSEFGQKLLAEANRLGLASETAKEMGPIPDWRKTIFAVLPRHLEMIELQHELLLRYASPKIRFALSGPFGNTARRDLIHAYREALWNLPADPERVDQTSYNRWVDPIGYKALIIAPAYGLTVRLPPFDESVLRKLGKLEKKRLAYLKD